MFIFGGPNFLIPQPTSGKLFGWGKNAFGCVGDGTTTNRYSPVQIGSNTNWSGAKGGYAFTCAINTAGKAYAWGEGADGRLGTGSTTDTCSPNQIGALTDWVPKGPFAIGGTRYGMHFIKANGTLWAWGKNNYGQIGDGTTTARSSPVQIGALTTWRYVSAGASEHVIAITTSGTMFSWGSGSSGRTGHSNTTSYCSPVQIGALTTWARVRCGGSSGNWAVRTDGKMFTWGTGTGGQLGLGNTTAYSSPKQVGALTTWASSISGTHHGGCIKSDNTLWSWGSGGSGRTGHNNTTDYSSPVQVTAPAVTWLYADAGQYSTMGQDVDGYLYMWGDGAQGQQGDGIGSSVSCPKQLGTEKWLSMQYISMANKHKHQIRT